MGIVTLISLGLFVAFMTVTLFGAATGVMLGPISSMVSEFKDVQKEDVARFIVYMLCGFSLMALAVWIATFATVVPC